MMSIEAGSLVDMVMRRWPGTLRVFLDYRMHCVGCPIACFHTVEEACIEHSADLEGFLSDLRAAAASTVPADCGMGHEAGTTAKDSAGSLLGNKPEPDRGG